MAGKLGGDDKKGGAKKGGGEVITLRPGAAKGAGGSRPRAAPAKESPRIPAARAKALVDERAIREANQLQLIGLRSQHRKVDLEIDVLREKLKEIGERRKMIRDAVSKIVSLKRFDEAYEDGQTSRVDLERAEQERQLIREAYGLPCGVQGDFLRDERVPEAAKPALYWKAEGYRCGISGLDPTEFRVPPENRQDFEAGLNDATEINGRGLKELKKAEADARTVVPRAPIVEEKPKEEGTVADAAKAHFEKLKAGEEEDVDEAELAARRPPGQPPAPAGDEEAQPPAKDPALVH